jgi:hypothetical protein
METDYATVLPAEVVSTLSGHTVRYTIYGRHVSECGYKTATEKQQPPNERRYGP